MRRWDKKTVFIYTSLLAIFCLAFVLRYIPFMRYDLRLLTNWADDWWFLGMARYFATHNHIPAIEPTYGNGIEYLYPPGLMLLFAVLTQITGLELVYLGKFVAIGLGALTSVFVYVLAKKLTNDYRVGLLSAILAISSVRYISRSAAFASELMGHLLIPSVLIFLYKGLKEKDDTSLFVSGLLLAGLILSHHLSAAVMLVTLSFFSFLLLIFKRRYGFQEIGKILVVISIGLVVSSLFWMKLLEAGVLNIVVKEAYSRESLMNLKNFYKNLGIPQFFLGVSGLVYAVYKRKTENLLLIAWGLPCFLGLWDRSIVTTLFGSNLLKWRPDLLYIFSPSLNTRYYDFLGQPLSILAALFFFSLFAIPKNMKNLKKLRAVRFFELISLILILVLIPLPVNSKLFYEGSGYNWLNWAMVSFISTDEYDAAVWMRENLPDDVNILSDYEANEMILGVTAKTVANGGTLRASLPVGTIYTDHLTIYFTDDLEESLRLIKKYNITHIFLSERMVDKGWFCVERNARFDYSYGSNMRNADLEKFDNSDCFVNIYDKSKVKFYEVNYGCDDFKSLNN